VVAGKKKEVFRNMVLGDITRKSFKIGYLMGEEKSKQKNKGKFARRYRGVSLIMPTI
jgi:hypothetical protein